MDPLLHELFSDPVGIMSLVTIGGVLVIALAITVIIRRKMGVSGAAEQKTGLRTGVGGVSQGS